VLTRTSLNQDLVVVALPSPAEDESLAWLAPLGKMQKRTCKTTILKGTDPLISSWLSRLRVALLSATSNLPDTGPEFFFSSVKLSASETPVVIPHSQSPPQSYEVSHTRPPAVTPLAAGSCGISDSPQARATVPISVSEVHLAVEVALQRREPGNP